MISVLLADDNRNWLEILEIGINREADFHVVGKAYDGRSTITMIEALRPNVIILDIIMPEFDGVYIVNHIRQTMPGYDPAIYILSGIGTDTVIKILNDLHVDFYSMKPVSLELVLDSLKKITCCQKTEQQVASQLNESKSSATPADHIAEVLIGLGIAPHLLSSHCVAQGLRLYLNKPGRSPMLTKELYPEIAKNLGVSSSSVEKNIRSAIAQMQKKQSDLYIQIFMHAYFSMAALPARMVNPPRLTNGEFLSIIAEYLRKK